MFWPEFRPLFLRFLENMSHFYFLTLILFALVYGVAGSHAGEENPSVVEVLTIDPRCVSHTKKTIKLDAIDSTTDIIGMVTLSHDEGAKLQAQMKVALSKKFQSPFVGQFPTYVIRITKGEKVRIVCISSYSGRWNEDGMMYSLNGKELVETLLKTLPLSSQFKKIKTEGDVLIMDRKKSFLHFKGETLIK